MTNKTLTKTAKRKILFDQTCQYITTLGFDGPHDDDGYGRINFFKGNTFLELQRSSMTVCTDEHLGGTAYDTTKIESFIENQKVALDLNI